MAVVFPIIGIVLGVLTCFIKGTTAAEWLVDGIGYSLAFTFFAVIGWLVFIAVCSLFVDTKTPQNKFDKFYNNVASLTLKFVLGFCNVKVKVEGEELLPKNERFVLIQNHRGMFDPIVSLAYFGKYEIGFVTKPENTHLPVINKFMHKICCIPIDRENPRNAVKSINAACELIKNDVCSIGIYPEGTRSKGEHMLPFHGGSFKIATKSGAPLVITTVSNTEKVSKNAPFKRTEVTLKVCKVIPGSETANSATADLAELSRKIMCEELGIAED